MMKISKWKLDPTLIFLGFGFAVWAGFFIRNSSFITINGQRSYSLFDDAMISMRYAWNFSHGNGLVWNAGEYVQGYTNLLMVLIMSVVTFVLSKTLSVLAIQILGVLFLLAIAYANMKIAGLIVTSGDSNAHKVMRILPFLCGLCYYPLAYWSIMGMETGLLCVLLLLGVYCALKYSQLGEHKYLWLFSTVGGAAFLTRNDSLIFFLILWVYIFTESSHGRAMRSSLNFFIAAFALYSVFIMGQLVFQYAYYGEWMPNTYVLKMTGMPTFTRLGNGIGFIVPFLKEVMIALIIALAGLILNFNRSKLLLFCLFGASVLYQIYVGGDPWNYWRMMAPTIPLLLLLDIDAILSITSKLRLSESMQISWSHALISTVVMIACLLGINLRFLPELFLQSPPYQSARNARSVNVAIVLNDILAEDATIGVYWAGTIPYYVNSNAIDFLGKSDRYIANLPPDLTGAVAFNGMSSVPGHNKYDLVYSISTLKPTYVQRFFWGGQDVSPMIGDEYVEVKYRNQTLYLLRNSADVNWKKLGL